MDIFKRTMSFVCEFVDDLCVSRTLNKQINDNFNKARFWHLALAVGVLALFLIALNFFGFDEPQVYPQIQRDIFLSLNALWQNAPAIAHNLTQLGDASVVFALLLCFALIAPKLWEALIAASLLSVVLTPFLKAFYAMPRPARAFGENAFNIIGEKLMGVNSFPSGHTTTIFTTICVLLFAFMPRTLKWRLPFVISLVLLGVLVGLSRVGVGAHYPLDVLAGSLLGCVCGLFGVLVAGKTRLFAWLNSRYGLLVFALMSALGVVMMLKHINKFNLFIFYPALLCAFVCLFATLRAYFATNLNSKNEANPIAFIFIISALWIVFFHFPLLEFLRSNLEFNSFSGALLFASLVLFCFALTLLLPLLLALISFKLTKIYFVLFTLTNALAVYFVSTYGVFLDKTMMGNLFNTNPAEAGEFLSLKMALWIVVLGIVPACFLFALKLAKPARKTLAKLSTLSLLTLILLAFINFSNLLWIDKHSKQLGALVMPYSYLINSARFVGGELAKNKREILLPDASIANDKKAVVVLVIGESARLKNFSLYGYERETNPLLSKVQGLRHFYAKSSTTYTSASVKNMLSHKDTSALYEILPNYLSRAGVSVVWRSANWGEPPLHLPSENVLRYSELSQKYPKLDDNYESALIANLSEEIKKANSPKVLIILHTSTSHGPTYYKKYPPEFEKFTPVCKSVEPKGCSQDEIINAYDNTILYTDFLLNSIIKELQGLDGFQSSLIYVSDHGESLGENGVYMHGIPLAFAPKEQYEIPFLVWSSEANKIKNLQELSHFYVFHSVLAFLGVKSEVFDENLNLFK